MSTDAIIFGHQIAQNSIYIFAGVFGGYFPCIFDLIQRHKLPDQQKIDLNKEFWLVKALLLPFSAFIITVLSVSGGSITGWFPALYLGATFPALLEKLMSIKAEDIKLPSGA